MAWRRTARAFPVSSSTSTITACSSRPVLGRLHAHRQPGEEALQNRLRLHADHRPVGAGHAAIRLVGGAPGQDARVGRRHVSVRPHHGGYAAVQIPAHRHFFAGHLGVKIHELHFNRRVDLTQEQIRFAKRTIGGRHVGAALQIDDRALHSVARLHCDEAVSRPVGIVCRTQQPRLAVQVIVKLALVPDMVAAGEHVQSQREKILGDRGRDAEPSRGVLRIGNRQVDLIRRDDVLHVVRHDPPSGRTEDITDK